MALPLCLEYFTRRLTLSFSLCNRSMLLSNFHLILQFFFPGKTLLGSLMQQRGVKTGNMLPCLFPRCRERACSLYGVGVGVCSGARLEGWLRCSAHLSGGGECRGMCSTLLLFPTFFIFYFFRISWVSRQGTSKLTSFQLFIRDKSLWPFQHLNMLGMINPPPTTSNGVPITIQP